MPPRPLYTSRDVSHTRPNCQNFTCIHLVTPMMAFISALERRPQSTVDRAKLVYFGQLCQQIGSYTQAHGKHASSEIVGAANTTIRPGGDEAGWLLLSKVVRDITFSRYLRSLQAYTAAAEYTASISTPSFRVNSPQTLSPVLLCDTGTCRFAVAQNMVSHLTISLGCLPCSLYGKNTGERLRIMSAFTMPRCKSQDFVDMLNKNLPF